MFNEVLFEKGIKEDMGNLRKCINKEKLMFSLLLFITFGLQIKYIFTELNIDTEYAIAMSWRMVKGDRMFQEMLEPHQTSAFLLAFFIKLFTLVTGTTEGIVIFLNAVGVLIHLGVTLCIYKTFKGKMEPFFLKLVCLFFMLLHPKGYVLPEFSNMSLWFGTLLFLSLIKYYDRQEEKRWLLLASFFLCMQIISYPSSIVVSLFVCGLLFLFSQQKLKDIVLFLSSCALQGSLYLFYFISRLGLIEFFDGIKAVFAGDRFHGTGSNIYGGIFNEGTLKAIGWIGINVFSSYLITRVYQSIRNKNRNDPDYNVVFGGFAIFTLGVFVSDICRAIFLSYYEYDGTWLNLYYIIFILYFFKGSRYLNEFEKRVVFTAYGISAGVLSAVCLVTNLSLTFSAQYIIIAVVMSFIPAMRWMKEKSIKQFWIYAMLFTSICMWTFKGFLDIREIGGLIKKGPAKGIVSEYMNAYKNNCNVEEWSMYVKENDSVLIVGQNSINALGYMIAEDSDIAIHSTMCGPTYNDALLEYWEKYPEKYPDVIAVECWYGNLKVEEDSWIMQWILDEYKPSTYDDGYYYRFYRKEE